jgi:hypothetical protein
VRFVGRRDEMSDDLVQQWDEKLVAECKSLLEGKVRELRIAAKAAWADMDAPAPSRWFRFKLAPGARWPIAYKDGIGKKPYLGMYIGQTKQNMEEGGVHWRLMRCCKDQPARVLALLRNMDKAIAWCNTQTRKRECVAKQRKEKRERQRQARVRRQVKAVEKLKIMMVSKKLKGRT